MKKSLLFGLLLMFFYPATALDTLKVQYSMIPVDSIPDGYFCLVVDCGFSKKAKYEIYYNNESYIGINPASQKIKWSLLDLRGKKNRCHYYAFILVKKDTSFSDLDVVPVEIYKKTFFGLFSRPVECYLQYYSKANYCVLTRPASIKKPFFVAMWVNGLRGCM